MISMTLLTKIKNSESRVRAIAKAISWRIVATLTTSGIAYTLTKEIKVAMMIGATEFFIKIVIYYGHERAWSFIK